MPAESRGRDYLRQFAISYGLLLAALVVECLIFELLARNAGRNAFLSLPAFVHVLNRSAVYGVLSVGMTLVILSGGIDLSVGSLVAFGGIVAALVVRWGVSGSEHEWRWIFAGWLAALAAGAASGTACGALITRFTVPPFVATLAVMSSLRGLGSILADGRPVSPLPSSYTVLGRSRIGDLVPMGVLVMLVVFAAGMIVIEWTRFGRHIRAIGGNEESARLSGVNVARVKTSVYACCGTLAALGGLINSSKVGSGDPTSGLGFELDVIAAVVVGGTSLSGGRGSIGGTLIGLLFVSVLAVGLNWIGVETFGQQVTLGVVILAAVLLDRLKVSRA
jgi:ribose/xylose/arabinose/galactoside ABC-type transport system permease subunit